MNIFDFARRFQGCIRHLRLDGRPIGLPEVMETYEVRAGCGWEFPCAPATGPPPCGPGQLCTQEGMSGHSCACVQPPCGSEADGTSPSSPPGWTAFYFTFKGSASRGLLFA
jgi:hypothetical protein